ncbi:serine/threonine-protein kinase [Mucilaginibacter oryzae]|uniref:Serine/threonine-protein kinase n=1 Tax=Mucilaginibacter oryzae TaxID=468058 RepID=A0A316GZQ6_9SPHI|nr:protein kinase [Mucilaginibacter oryzae]PWK72522.1 serine/threonine-protein kinase [Mucilaginibacter oryzae]
MTSIALSQGLIDHFKISEYEQATTPSGQKTVFIVKIEGVKYALKIIHIADERFEREVKICQQYNHITGIPSILKVEKYLNDTIILEEYIEGNDLSDILDQYKGDHKKVIDLIFKIGTILKPVWYDKYVHRDLKPQNIRIRANGDPVVLDFGIARALDEESITATGGQPLSWYYASPEQYAGQKNLISYKTDFFCLGIVAYFLYTNRLPFGNTKDLIAQTFTKTIIHIDSGNKYINEFCNGVFYTSPSDRPRKIETFLKLAQI